MIVVCPLSRLTETVVRTGARHIVTLMGEGAAVPTPAGIDKTHHLVLHFNDISEPLEGYTLPQARHMEHYLEFVDAWDGAAPLLVHCWAGISRSTAGAYIAACARNPARDEEELALTLRRLSPSATPNRRLVALADAALGRAGRMNRAIAAIGRGCDAFEGEPFHLPVEIAP